MYRLLPLTLLCALIAQPAVADIRVDRMARQTMDGVDARMLAKLGVGAIATTVIVKGPRRLTRTGDIAEIVDLVEERVYVLDMKKRTYTATTFAELRTLHASLLAHGAAATPQNAAVPLGPLPSSINHLGPVRIDRTRKATDRRRVISGFDTQEVVSTITATTPDAQVITMTVTEWLTPDVAGYWEIAAFEDKYAAMVRRVTTAAAMGLVMPSMSTGTNDDDGTTGIPVLTVMVTGGSNDAAAGSEDLEKPAPSRLKAFAKALGRHAVGRSQSDVMRGYTGAIPRSTMEDALVSMTTTVTDEELAVPGGFRLLPRRN